MFEALLRRLTGPARPAPLPEPDARLALAALLVRAARVNGDYSQPQIDRIDRVLATRYGLDADAARELRERAEVLESEAPDTVRFTRAVKAATPLEEREAELEAMWEIVLIDGAHDHDESGLMRLVANLLGINDRDNALARRRVKRRLG
ncbi:TerB family tellurite resistance protein [Alkalilacustris brevis]|uniref:tellurite resistance TerB family protein n=1 Tax=Alkalilacustris brevis TaxID=2026338 RepID=UPI000E0CE703|nr:TerB family tellurite resistance protein [Alkalilacustris brevis]